MKNKTILLGLDGATWLQFDKFISMGHMKNLENILKNGIRANFNSFFPYSSKPSWVSIFTGTNPGKHGVPNYNPNFKPELPLLWQILSDANIRFIAINEPLIYPIQKINGIMITGGFGTPSDSTNFCYPPNLKEEIYQKVSDFIPSIKTTHIEKLKGLRFEEAYQEYDEYESKIITIANHMIEKYEWDFFYIFLNGTDVMHHCYWDKPIFLKKYYQKLDKVLGNFYNIAVKYNANLVGISDHGSGPVKKHFLVNSWLMKLGYADFEKPGLIRNALSNTKLTKKNIGKFLSKMHLLHYTLRFTPKSIKNVIPAEKDEFAYFYDKSLQKGVFSKEINEISIKNNKTRNFEKLRDEIIEKLKEIEDDGEKIVAEVHKGEDIFKGPYQHRAPDILFLLKDGYLYNNEIKNEYLLPSSIFDKMRSGGHRPEGILFASGPDFPHGANLSEPMMIWDFLPNLLHMLDVKIPTYFDGKVIPEIFDKKSLLYSKRVEYRKESEKEFLQKKIAEKRSFLEESLRKRKNRENFE